MCCWNLIPGRLVLVAEFDLTAKITAALQEYDDQVAEAVDAAADDCAKRLKKDLQNSSPSATGAYAKSWTHRTNKEFSKGSKVYTIYNKNHYQLTHLLEKGHGGPAPAHPHVHIEPAEKKWTEEFLKICEEVCEG